MTEHLKLNYPAMFFLLKALSFLSLKILGLLLLVITSPIWLFGIVFQICCAIAIKLIQLFMIVGE